MEANWESSDETVAVIEYRPIAGSREALALKVGEVTITGTDSATGIQATTTLKVTAAVLQRIEITPANPTLDVTCERERRILCQR